MGRDEGVEHEHLLQTLSGYRRKKLKHCVESDYRDQDGTNPLIALPGHSLWSSLRVISALTMISLLFRWSSRDRGFGKGLHMCCILETHLVVHWAAQGHHAMMFRGSCDKWARLKLKPWLQHICTREAPARKHGLIDAAHLFKWHEAPARKHITPGRVQETLAHFSLPKNVGLSCPLSWWPSFSLHWENRSN